MNNQSPYAIIDLGGVYEVRSRATGAVMAWCADLPAAERHLKDLLSSTAARGTAAHAAARAVAPAGDARMVLARLLRQQPEPVYVRDYAHWVPGHLAESA